MRTESIGEPLPPVTDTELPLQSVYRWEAERPDALYMVQPLGGGRLDEYSWQRTLDEARRLATYLKGKGYAPGTSIALVSKNCAHHFIFELGIWMAGYVSVSVYPTVDAETLGFVLEHSESPLVFVGKLDVWPSMASGVPDTVEILTCELSPNVDGATDWKEILATTAPMEGNPVRAADETAMLLYTSGSTGKPKGVVITFGAATTTGRSLDPLVHFSTSDRALSYLPLAHAMERCLIVVPSMMFGFQVYFAESLETFVDDLKRTRPTIFASVPRLWLKFKAGVEAKMPPEKLQRLLSIPIVRGLVRKKVLQGLGLDAARICGTGSAPMPQEIHEWYRALGIEFLDSYGMSEIIGLAALSRPGNARPGTVGPALPGASIRISDIGEVEMKSPGMMTGYFKAPELTAESFTEDGWLRTGDQGAIDDDGQLRITGRVKELFKTSKGKYVAPAPIEGMLNATDLVEQSCVMGMGSPQPFAVVMLSDEARAHFNDGGRDATLQELESVLADVNSQVAGHERLSKLVVTGDSWEIANGLLTPTMKIKRSAIEERYDSSARELGQGVFAL